MLRRTCLKEISEGCFLSSAGKLFQYIVAVTTNDLPPSVTLLNLGEIKLHLENLVFLQCIELFNLRDSIKYLGIVS